MTKALRDPTSAKAIPQDGDDIGRRYRVVIWGPGEVGGDAIRRAHAGNVFDVVGVKAFSPQKNGVDAGELVGIGPIGVRATTSRDEILALDADCVICTPSVTSPMEGLDDDVIAMLESGKNVITTAAYHNVAMPNWYNTASSPTERLRAVSRVRGVAQKASERRALAVARVLTRAQALDRFTDPILRPLVDRRMPARASDEQILRACRTGGSTLHGTGVHPTSMVERLVLRLAQSVQPVSHIRFVEAGNIAQAPEGMWGGLEFLGYGQPIDSLGDDHFLAYGGDMYYGDMIGNVAHTLFGARPEEVRIERGLRALPARHDYSVGSTSIKAGSAAAMHITHKGYLGDHHFFTNEECWYLGGDHAYFGPGIDPPIGLPDDTVHNFVITGQRATLRGSRTYTRIQKDVNHPMTGMSVRAMLNAVPAVVAAGPGVLIDDVAPRYRLANGDPA